MEFVFNVLQAVGVFRSFFGGKSIVILLLRNKPKYIKEEFDSKGNIRKREITYRDFPQ